MAISGRGKDYWSLLLSLNIKINNIITINSFHCYYEGLLLLLLLFFLLNYYELVLFFIVVAAIVMLS